ncbi:MAG: hypothetical protein ABIJ31_03770 [Pseudomonadota bacterium]
MNTPTKADTKEHEKEEGKQEVALEPDCVEDTKKKEMMEFIEKSEPPPHVKEIMLGMMRSSSTSGPMPHPIVSKLNDEHIHKFLDYSQKDDQNAYELTKSNRWFRLIYAILAASVFLFLIVFLLPNNKELLIDLIKILIAFVGGLGAGLGLKDKLIG